MQPSNFTEVVGAHPSVTQTSMPATELTKPEAPDAHNEPGGPMDLAAACAAAEEAFQRGDITRARASADELLSAARARRDRAAEARALHLLGELDYDFLAYPRALANFEGALAIREEILGEADPRTRYTRLFRAIVLASEHRPDESDAELARATPSEGVPATPEDAARNARLWGAVGAVLHARDRDREAARIFEAVIAAAEQGEPIEPLTLANVYLHFSSVLEVLGESLRARGMCRKMLEIRRSIIGVPSLRVGLGLVGLGSSFIRSGRVDEARAALEESATMLRASGHEAHPRASVVYLGLAVAEIMGGRGPLSERWISRAIELETKTFGGAHPSSAAMTLTASKIFALRGHHTRAAELAQRAAAALLSSAGSRPELFKEAVGQGFLSLRHLKRHDAIVRWLEPLLASLERLDPPALNAMAPLLNMIAEAYASAGKLSKAEATLRRSIKITEQEHGAESEPMQVLFTNLADLLAKQRRSAEAHDARARAARIEEAIEARARLPFMSRWRRGSA